MGMSTVAQRVAAIYLLKHTWKTRRVAARVAREFSSPEALQEYLRKHPKADKSKHTVGKPGGKSKDSPEKGSDEPKKDDAKPKQKSLWDELDDYVQELGKGMSKGKFKRTLEQAIENEDAAAEGRKPKQKKDLSKEEGFEALEGLSHSEQVKAIEKAMKELDDEAKADRAQQEKERAERLKKK